MLLKFDLFPYQNVGVKDQKSRMQLQSRSMTIIEQPLVGLVQENVGILVFSLMHLGFGYGNGDLDRFLDLAQLKVELQDISWVLRLTPISTV